MKLYTIALASLFVTSTIAQASVQSTRSASRPRGERTMACQQDAVKFCADKTGRELRACLQYNASSLSGSCKASVASTASGNPGFATR
jgi:hypothetical protein